MNITSSDSFQKQINILPIIIIGSGISGLTIASKIKDNNFLILEARDRIGGRVYTNEKNMDMGAAWIHGSDNNPLNKYLNFDNLLPISNSNPWMHSENIPIKYLSNKYNITEEKRQQLASIWNELATKIGNKHDKTIIEGFEEIKEENLDEYKYNKEDLFSFLYMIEVWCGGSIKNVSTSFLHEEKYNSALFGDYGGAHYIFKNGASSLIDALLNSANEKNIKDKIIYNQIVSKVVYKDSYVEVYTNEGQIYYCNQLCITVPPGPLKNITFCPPLDSKRLESLSRIKLGSYKKIQLEFLQEDVFWNDNNTPMFLTYNSKIDGEEYYLNKIDDESKSKSKSDGEMLFPYILWNNYNYSKNKPILEAICPADIGWQLTGLTDEKIIDTITSHLKNYYPNMPEPFA
jgi:hypothetical protein